jgi:chlorobactene glucosyltransferase
MELLLSSVWFLVALWLIARAYRQRDVFEAIALHPGNPNSPKPAIAVIVPVRDERANVLPCIESLLRQDYPAECLRIIVVDDDSSDGTAELVERLAATDRRLTLARTPALPPDWKGKTHACSIGARSPQAQVEWLCFIDADMRAEPQLMASAIDAAVSGRLELLSLAPRHELHSLAERLIIPSGLFLLGFSQDLEKIQKPEGTEVVATGQFMLMRRQAYEEVGGHAAVCSAICEDVELARLLKRRGLRVLLQDGSAFLSTRMYTGWRTLWPGIAKNLTHVFGGPVRTVALVVVAVAMAWSTVLVPAADVLSCSNGAESACFALVPALLGSAAIFALHIAGAAHFQIPAWYGLLFPVSYTAAAIIALDSVRWRLTGRVRWKGRVYHDASEIR